MTELSASDRASLEEIEREELNPGSGLISQAHSDEMVTLGWARGSFAQGYSLTEEGRSVLAAARA